MLHVALSTSAAGLLVFCLAVLMLTPLVVVEALAHRRRQRAVLRCRLTSDDRSDTLQA